MDKNCMDCKHGDLKETEHPCNRCAYDRKMKIFTHWEREETKKDNEKINSTSMS